MTLKPYLFINQQNMKYVLYIIVTIIFCTLLVTILLPKEQYYKHILSLEQQLGQRPDFVLTSLQQIDPSLLIDKERALYYLLLTKSFEQLGHTASSDSLISLSLNYYLENQDSLRLFQSYYLRGRIFHKSIYLIEASNNYQNAENYVTVASDLRTLCLLKYYKSLTYHFTMMWKEEKKAILKSLYNAQLLNDSALISQSLHTLSAWYYNRSNYEQSNTYLKQAVYILPLKKQTSLCEMYASISENYLKLNKPNLALQFINQAISGTPSGTQLYQYENIKAKSYFWLQKKDSAQYYFAHSIDSLQLPAKVTAYYDLYIINKYQGSLKEANNNLLHHLQLRDSLDLSQKKTFIKYSQEMQSHRKYKRAMHTTELELSKTRIIFYRVVTGFLILIIILIIILYRKQAKLRIEKCEKVEILFNQHKIENQLLKERDENARAKINQLELRVIYYKQLNDITLPFLIRFQKQQKFISLTDEEWNMIIKNTDSCFNQFTERLKKEYSNIDIEDLRFCCLIKMELPLSLIANIYYIAKESISRKKMRMKEKMGIRQGSFDDFISSF